MPRVSVVMAVFNAAPFLRESIGSILAQTYLDFELIAVDDASSDDSLAVLKSFDDPRIKLLSHERNQGASISRNEAVSIARGEFIAIMDADDVCACTRLERQVEYLDSHFNVGLVGCGVYETVDIGGEVLHTSRMPINNNDIQDCLMQEWCFLHSSIMFRKTLFEIVEGYTQAFEPVEDHDLVLRLLEHCEAHNLPEALVSYRFNPTGLTVQGRGYIETLRSSVILLAQRRHSGSLEDREATISRISEIKKGNQASRGVGGVIERLSRSFDAAGRYYAIGCLELCGGRLDTARRCFWHSVSANRFFLKSWMGIGLSFMPSVAERAKFFFRTSMQHEKPTQSWVR
jgi:glycosyltransferase involved in cell wall biosynthesis